MTENITMKDHSDGHYVTSITAVQQQFEDLRPIREFNILVSQDHGMINIEDLINDWLREAI